MHIICTDNYGLTEVMGPGVSGECLACRDMQHIAEDHFFWEIVDPKTGEPLPEGVPASWCSRRSTSRRSPSCVIARTT